MSLQSLLLALISLNVVMATYALLWAFGYLRSVRRMVRAARPAAAILAQFMVVGVCILGTATLVLWLTRV